MTNPATEDAEEAYTGFHWGRKPKKRREVDVSPLPESLAELGRIEAITYATTKGSEGYAHWEHEFGEDGGEKPTLAVDPKTNRLHIVGGTYTVEDRGIVD